MTEDQIKHMVNRFLGWKLPDNFNPDGGIGFKRTFNDHLPTPSKNEPSGTNLFDAAQAEAMVRYMVEGLPSQLTQDNIIQLIRTKYDPEPNDWPRHRGWDDGAQDIAAEIMAKFDAAIAAIKRA